MKNLKIQVPEGYEIDKENSTFEEIIFKKKATELPKSIEEIPNRNWYLYERGGVKFFHGEPDINQVSSRERAEAFLALMQLVELRDAWNEASDAEWHSSGSVFVIKRRGDVVGGTETRMLGSVLEFKTPELRDQFLAQFRNLIETAKELI